MSSYQKMKNRYRNEAIDWQMTFDDHNYSYGELAEWLDYFYRVGKRYGLMAEFRENGIL